MKDGNAWLVMSLGLLLLTLAVLHAARAANMDMLQPCQDDVQKYCAQVKPGQGRMARCLKSHEAELSDTCRTHLKTMFDHMLEARQACKADAEKLCADVRGGHGRIVACLRRNEKALSESCREEMMR